MLILALCLVANFNQLKLLPANDSKIADTLFLGQMLVIHNFTEQRQSIVTAIDSCVIYIQL